MARRRRAPSAATGLLVGIQHVKLHKGAIIVRKDATMRVIEVPRENEA
jgi:hypothetical protein